MSWAMGWLEQALGATRLHLWLAQLAIAFGMLAVGIWISKWLCRGLDRLMKKFEVEEILRSFLRNVAYGILLVVVFIAALDFIGVPTTSLLAVVGAAGLAIGLALKDSLSNTASGVMLIVLRPFHIGDQVQVAGQEGVVQSVHIFQTWLITPDNRQIILPNSQITSAPIINYTGTGVRRIDLNVPMPFSEELPELRAMLRSVAAANARVQKSPAPEVAVVAVTETIVTAQLQAWVAARDYNAVRSELLEGALAEFQQRGMRSAQPPREVHLHHHNAPATLSDEALKPALPRDTTS
jgi:small conductance mechanosensitive channel